MTGITSHVLDTATGSPARGLQVRLERQNGDAWVEIGAALTNEDGRAPGLMEDVTVAAGIYRMTFETGAWFAAAGRRAFYPVVHVTFDIADGSQHYHVPLLLSPFGYSTYRGS